MHESTELRLKNRVIYNILDRGGKIDELPDKVTITFDSPLQFTYFVEDQVNLLRKVELKDLNE